jgi:hypothetical protein
MSQQIELHGESPVDCCREFTNLKHHINQQHSQVGSYAVVPLVSRLLRALSRIDHQYHKNNILQPHSKLFNRISRININQQYTKWTSITLKSSKISQVPHHSTTATTVPRLQPDPRHHTQEGLWYSTYLETPSTYN